MKKNRSFFLAMFAIIVAMIAFNGCDIKQRKGTDPVFGEEDHVFQEAWSKEIPNGVTSSPNYGDLDGDGDLEVVVGGRDGKIYAFHHNGDVVQGWPVRTGSYIYAAPAVGDINNDGMLEVVAISNDGKMYALTGNGALLPGWPLKVEYSSPSTGGATGNSAPLLADVDGDKKLDIIYTSIKYNNLMVLNYLARALPGWPQRFYSGEFTVNTPAVGDIDGDGSVEIACGVIHAHDANYNKVYVWNHDGTPLPGWPKKFEDYWWSEFTSMAFADINDDGAVEIVFSDFQFVYVTNIAGEMLPGWPVDLRFCLNYRCVVIADLNGDRTLEVVVSDACTGLYAFDFKGKNLPGFPVNLELPGRLAVADINDDNKNEIVIGANYPGNSYRALTADGILIDDFSLVTSRYTSASPLILDLNGDGGVDIVGAEIAADGNMGHLFVWSSTAPFNSTLKGWRMFHYDPRNSGMVPVEK